MNQFINDVASSIKELRSVLRRDASVLLITHAQCLDGMACELITRKFLPQAVVVKMSPSRMDDYIAKLDSGAEFFDVTIIADVSTNVHSFLDRKNVIMVDHHDSALSLNDPDNLCFVTKSACGSKLLWTMLQMVFKENLNCSDFIDVVNDHDLWLLQDQRSKPMNSLYYKYGDEAFAKRFNKLKADLNEEEMKWYADKLAATIDKAKTMEITELLEGVGLYVDNVFSNDLMHEILEHREFHTIVTYKPAFGGVSIRTKHPDVNIGSILTRCGSGGGHKAAGGFTANNQEHFRNIMDMFIGEVETILKLEVLPF